MSVDESVKDIEFAIKGNHLAEEFTIFASPSPSSFGSELTACGDNICDKKKGEDYSNCPADCPKPYWRAVGWVVLILIVIGGGIFAIWKYYASRYDKNLRAKLFKPADDFYKISFFISNAMNKGGKEREILDALEKAGWKKSQIDYAMQKVRESTRAMQKKSILSYVYKEISSGEDEKSIREKLKDSGWKPDLIDWAFKNAKKLRK
jgi:hypothetical protein